jgi:hypothetical protein
MLERGEGLDAVVTLLAGACAAAGAFVAAFAGCGFGFALRVAGTGGAEDFAGGIAEVDIL